MKIRVISLQPQTSPLMILKKRTIQNNQDLKSRIHVYLIYFICFNGSPSPLPSPNFSFFFYQNRLKLEETEVISYLNNRKLINVQMIFNIVDRPQQKIVAKCDFYGIFFRVYWYRDYSVISNRQHMNYFTKTVL